MIQTRISKSSITKDEQSVKLIVEGLSSVAFDITGTFVGTTIFEYTINGTDWYTLTANVVGAATTATGSTDVGKWSVNVAGFYAIRVRCSAYTSGTIVVAINATLAGSRTVTPQSDVSTTTKSATIANGASLSEEIDLGGYGLAAIEMPAAWTAANLTFQAASASAGTFKNVYDAAGNQLTVTADASRVLTDIPELAPLRFIKIRSGTSGTPVNQGAERTITLILKG